MNVIQVICHDLGRELGCYGRPVLSPHLDAFAEGAVRFENAHCNAACCSPARASLMAGRHAHQSGMLGLAHRGWSLAPEELTAVDVFNGAGFETVHAGHQHERISGDNRYGAELRRSRDDDFAENAVDQAVAYLRSRRNRKRPMYLNVGLRDPHPSVWRSFASEGGHRPEYFPYIPQRAERPQGIPEGADPGPMRQYYGAIRFMDEQVGRLFVALRELGYFDDSVVLFTTDHGPAYGAAARAKGTLYTMGTGVALLIRLPGGRHGGLAVPGLAQHIDAMPTLLEAAGVAPPPWMTGRSHWGELQRGEYAAPEAVFCERTYHGGPESPGYYQPSRSIRTEGRLLVKHFAGKGEPPGPKRRELFDLAEDPYALRDVAADPARQGEADALDARLQEWMRGTDDPLLEGHVFDPLAASPDKRNAGPA